MNLNETFQEIHKRRIDVTLKSMGPKDAAENGPGKVQEKSMEKAQEKKESLGNIMPEKLAKQQEIAPKKENLLTRAKNAVVKKGDVIEAHAKKITVDGRYYWSPTIKSIISGIGALTRKNGLSNLKYFPLISVGYNALEFCIASKREFDSFKNGKRLNKIKQEFKQELPKEFKKDELIKRNGLMERVFHLKPKFRNVIDFDKLKARYDSLNVIESSRNVITPQEKQDLTHIKQFKLAHSIKHLVQERKLNDGNLIIAEGGRLASNAALMTGTGTIPSLLCYGATMAVEYSYTALRKVHLKKSLAKYNERARQGKEDKLVSDNRAFNLSDKKVSENVAVTMQLINDLPKDQHESKFAEESYDRIKTILKAVGLKPQEVEQAKEKIIKKEELDKKLQDVEKNYDKKVEDYVNKCIAEGSQPNIEKYDPAYDQKEFKKYYNDKMSKTYLSQDISNFTVKLEQKMKDTGGGW